jgi:hypothetical protein
MNHSDVMNLHCHFIITLSVICVQDFVLQSPGVASEPILQCQSEPQSQGSIPPPSYHSVPDTSSERGAPPSYDEAIDPQGSLYWSLLMINLLRPVPVVVFICL